MMNSRKIEPRFIVILSIILFGAGMRLIPHWPNFTPIAAMALFGGAYFPKKHLAFLIPVAALLISDLILGLHQWMIAVYVSFALVVGIGIWMKNRIRVGTLILASVSSSTLFYLITNFAIWIGSPFYPKHAGGLVECYVAALPFFFNGLVGDLFFTAIFFGSYYAVSRRIPALSTK